MATPTDPVNALANARAVLLDLDGVLYVEDEPIAGAGDAVRRLRDAGLGVRLVTNTTSRPRRMLVERLERLGFDVAAAIS
jgi:ribonucleotide monophosphatase NagD (HAD superfamily)